MGTKQAKLKASFREHINENGRPHITLQQLAGIAAQCREELQLFL